MAGFTLGSAHGATLIFGDDYNVINNGTGFNANNGVNSGINPPTTRLQGTAAADVRYIKVEGMRGGNVHYITNSVVGSPPGKLYVGSGINASRLSLTNNSGGGLTDFGPALFSSAATPSVPSIYELRVNLAHFGTNRVSFGISTANDAPPVWDFGIELVRSLGSGPLSLYKRIDQVSGGVGQDVNVLITNNVGAGGEELTFVFRITDAGADSTAFNSRVELAVVRGGTTNWIYDTQRTPNGLHRRSGSSAWNSLSLPYTPKRVPEPSTISA